MKVIKKGREQKGWAKEFECTGKGNGNGGCGAILLVEQGDLFHTHSHARDETETYTTFRCVECGVMTDIPHPQGIRNLPTRSQRDLQRSIDGDRDTGGK